MYKNTHNRKREKMKRQTATLGLLLVFMVIASSPVGAALLERSGGLIYDDDLDITWLANANYAQTSGYDADGLMNWSGAMAWAASLEFGGAVDWRLPAADPTCTSDVNCINSEMGHLFYTELSGTAWTSIDTSSDPDLNLFTNIQLGQKWYWTSTPSTTYSGASWTFNFTYGWQDELYNYSEQPVWAVHDGDVASVPLPGAVWLLGSCLIGLVGIRKRFKK